MPPTIQKTIEEFEKERTDAISEMFDNVDEHGIYPTTIFFNRLDVFLTQALTSQAQMMVDIVEGNRKKSNVTTDEHSDLRQLTDIYYKGYTQALTDILTSYKESGLIK